jgi:hypothetical protein
MPAKEYSLDFEDRGNYLYAHLTGKDSYAASLDYWSAIAGKARALGHDRLLVHEKLVGDVSEGEMFSIMMDILPSSIGIKVAFFDENHVDTQINELGHLIATNRGATIRIFQSLADAENWIGTAD